MKRRSSAMVLGSRTQEMSIAKLMSEIQAPSPRRQESQWIRVSAKHSG